MSGGGHEGEKVVCVTGASGYIASWLVKLLLLRGYVVRATIRNPDDPKKTEHLLSLDGAKERLHLFKADLLIAGSFDHIVRGCEGVFHTASPVFFAAVDPQRELIEPALGGTTNVLRSCAKVSSIKRVVITSSMASVAFNGKPVAPSVVIDETWFSDPKFCEEFKFWYPLSKTLAEEAAWRLAKENGMDMVTIHPGWVIGPLLQPTVNFSVEPVLNLIKGNETFPNKTNRWVDVRDVASAHIQAYEIPSAHGRYCVVGTVQHTSDTVKILRELYPTLRLPERCEDDKPFDPIYQVSKEKARSLGITFTPLELSLKDTIKSFMEKGIFST